MFIITVNGKETDGAYAVKNSEGDKVLYIFEEEDDAVRYAMMLEEDGYPEMHVIEIEDDVMIKTCESYGYQYALISNNDIVIPPEEDDFV